MTVSQANVVNFAKVDPRVVVESDGAVLDAFVYKLCQTVAFSPPWELQVFNVNRIVQQAVKESI